MRIRYVGAVLAAVLLIAPSTFASEGAAQRDSSKGEFVVTYASGALADATRSIEEAGGTVVDVIEAVGMLLVSSGNASFLEDVRGSSAITGAMLNHSVGTTDPGMPHRFVIERPAKGEARSGNGNPSSRGSRRGGELLADLQWDMKMIGATQDGAWKRATGRGVTVGIIDTGVDASHPDIAPNFSYELSRNFTMDIPTIDGPCDYATCIDPSYVDNGGHGTHVAGTVGAARNGIGIAGVAPDATIVNVRAGQDSGYFFLYETVAALTYAGDAQLDVVNMSFYTDPWLFNCDSADDFISGEVSEEQLAEQALTKQLVTAALQYAHDQGVTLVAAAGNSHVNLALSERSDATSPDYPGGTEIELVVTDDCLTLPSEGPHVIQVSAVGPSTTKADYSNYGLGEIDVSAPGGWFRDLIGTPAYRTDANLVLSSYPLDLAIEEGLADASGHPVDSTSVADCSVSPCAFYHYLQGTSMASPHATGVAALIVEAHGSGNPAHGYSLAPDTVRSILLGTATDHACPAGGTEIYTDEGRPPDFNSVCDGTTTLNGIYGEGLINATAAVAK
jgi:subtilisin family serine protease